MPKGAGHVTAFQELPAPMVWLVICRLLLLLPAPQGLQKPLRDCVTAAGASHQMPPTPSVPMLLAAPPEPLGHDAASRQRPPLVEQGEKPLLHTQVPAWQSCAMTAGK